jgi:hypothetical protein
MVGALTVLARQAIRQFFSLRSDAAVTRWTAETHQRRGARGVPPPTGVSGCDPGVRATSVRVGRHVRHSLQRHEQQRRAGCGRGRHRERSGQAVTTPSERLSGPWELASPSGVDGIFVRVYQAIDRDDGRTIKRQTIQLRGYQRRDGRERRRSYTGKSVDNHNVKPERALTDVAAHCVAGLSGALHQLIPFLMMFAASCLGCAWESEDWSPVQRDLSTSEAVSTQFTSHNNGSHEVVLEFAWPIRDPGVLELVNDAAATTGSAGAPTFDFAWQLLKEGHVVAQRESPQRSTGVVDTGTTGLGGGPLKSRGLVFGGFDLKAGDVYTLRVVPGPGFAAIVGVTPRIVVERKLPLSAS